MYDEYDLFDKTIIKKSDMIELANSIEYYLDLFTNIMILPSEDISKKENAEIKESIIIVEKLIKKLKNGDKSVFKSL